MSHPFFDDLPSLLCFARVVELGSFTKAASALGVSKSVVSARISALETRLGERLLLRTSRKLTVTAAGLEVYESAARMLSNAALAMRDASASAAGVLRIGAPFAFAERHLAVPLARFGERHPNVRVEVVLDDRLVDLTENRLDLAIRITKLADSTLVARKLASTTLHICGSPAYFAKYGIPKTPADLLSHAGLRYSLLRAEDEWRLYDKTGRLHVPIEGRFECSSGTLLRAAALAGMGLAMLPRFMVDEELAAGRLETVLDAHVGRPLGIYALHAGGKGTPARLRALIDTLVDAFRKPVWS